VLAAHMGIQRGNRQQQAQTMRAVSPGARRAVRSVDDAVVVVAAHAIILPRPSGPRGRATQETSLIRR